MPGTYQLNAFRDGKNADYQGMHYNRQQFSITVPDNAQGASLPIHLAPNGGWAAIVE